MATSYSGDPHWLSAKYPGKCAKKDCNQPFKKGERIFYYPKYKEAYYGECANAAARDFTTMAQDEDYYNNKF